jgi:hypothetical protein
MKKTVRAAEGRTVTFPKATLVGAGRSIVRMVPADPPVELEVDRFVRGRLLAGDLVEVKPAASVPAPAPAPAVAGSPVKES